jgi:hypothetical protein
VLSDDIMKTPQPRSVWILAISLPIVVVVFLCVYRMYHIILYIDAAFLFLLSIEDIVLKFTERRILRMQTRNGRGFHNKFLKNSFLEFALAVLYLGLGWLLFVLSGDTFWAILLGFVPLCVVPFMVIVDARVLLEAFSVKTVEGQE